MQHDGDLPVHSEMDSVTGGHPRGLAVRLIRRVIDDPAALPRLGSPDMEQPIGGRRAVTV